MFKASDTWSFQWMVYDMSVLLTQPIDIIIIQVSRMLEHGLGQVSRKECDRNHFCPSIFGYDMS